MIATATQFASIASILGFAITLAVTGATYYQAFKMRQEARLTKTVAKVTSLTPTLAA